MSKGNNILVKNVILVDYKKNITGDIYIENGKIKEVGENIQKNCLNIQGEGLYLLPSFIDTHAHFRDPGLTYKEDIISGSNASVKGGYTGVNLMANTSPPISSMEEALDVIRRGSEYGKVDIHQSISITKAINGEELTDIWDIEFPVKAISDDGFDIEDSSLFYKAMERARDKNIIVMAHSEDKHLAKINSRLSENINVIRNIELAKETHCLLHLCHVSTKEAMEYIIDEKKRGSKLTCEVTPHHISLFNNNYKVNPEIREEEDLIYIKNAIKEGFVDTIGTDHAPHSTLDKENGANGISGIETSFSICYTSLVKDGWITLNKLSEIMSKNGADLLSFNKGRLEEGYDGDIVLVDLNKEITIESENFYSKGKNTPFEGMKFWGEIVLTIKGGEIVYDNR